MSDEGLVRRTEPAQPASTSQPAKPLSASPHLSHLHDTPSVARALPLGGPLASHHCHSLPPLPRGCMLIESCVLFKALSQTLPFPISIMSILRPTLQIRRLRLRGIKGHSQLLAAPRYELWSFFFFLECASTFILPGICYDLKNDFLLELGSVQPDRGSS